MANGPDTVEDVSVAVQSGHSFWRVPWDFAIHGIVGTLIFAIIAAFAVALDITVHALEETHRISGLVIFGLEAAAYSLFITDLFLFLVFLIRTAKRTMRDL